MLQLACWTGVCPEHDRRHGGDATYTYMATLEGFISVVLLLYRVILCLIPVDTGCIGLWRRIKAPTLYIGLAYVHWSFFSY